jgi:magnesium-transporting ATPase (P-type)
MSVLTSAAKKTAKEIGQAVLFLSAIASFIVVSLVSPGWAAILLITVLVLGTFYGNYKEARREEELEEARAHNKKRIEDIWARVEETGNVFETGSSPKAGSEVKISCTGTGGRSGCGDKSTV